MIEARARELAAAHDLGTDAAARLAALAAAMARPHALTAVHEPAAALERHVADSLAALEVDVVRSAPTLADIGAGAGFPGLALAVALPTTRVWLVESVGRKCDFMTNLAADVGITNVEVVNARAEEWRAGAGRCAVVTARALAALPVVLEYAAPLLEQDGVAVVWKGRRAISEEADAAAAAAVLGLELRDVHRVAPHAAALERHLYVYCKVSPTPARFPRRPGVARKRPLRAEASRAGKPTSDRARR